MYDFVDTDQDIWLIFKNELADTYLSQYFLASCKEQSWKKNAVSLLSPKKIQADSLCTYLSVPHKGSSFILKEKIF